jgi:hypothetical protein
LAGVQLRQGHRGSQISKTVIFFWRFEPAWQAGSAELLAAGLSEKNVAEILEKRKNLSLLTYLNI